MEVPFLADLDVLATEFTSPDENRTRDMRSAWKEYLLTRLPPHSEIQIKNFMRVVSVQGRVGDEDEEGRTSKLTAVTVPLTPDKIESIFAYARGCLSSVSRRASLERWVCARAYESDVFFVIPYVAFLAHMRRTSVFISSALRVVPLVQCAS